MHTKISCSEVGDSSRQANKQNSLQFKVNAVSSKYLSSYENKAEALEVFKHFTDLWRLFKDTFCHSYFPASVT
jgi:hypothetical protein